MSVSISQTSDMSRMSWSFSNKDGNGDGKVSYAEYTTPVPEGGSVLQPADMEHAESMKDMFADFDHNKDGFVTAADLLQAPTNSFARQRSEVPRDMKALADAVEMYKKFGNPVGQTIQPFLLTA